VNSNPRHLLQIDESGSTLGAPLQPHEHGEHIEHDEHIEHMSTQQLSNAMIINIFNKNFAPYGAI
jgi:hypothetical protein